MSPNASEVADYQARRDEENEKRARWLHGVARNGRLDLALGYYAEACGHPAPGDRVHPDHPKRNVSACRLAHVVLMDPDHAPVCGLLVALISVAELELEVRAALTEVVRLVRTGQRLDGEGDDRAPVLGDELSRLIAEREQVATSVVPK